VAALADLLSIGHNGVADARAPLALGADDHHLAGSQRGFLLDYACLARALATLGVLLDYIYAFYNYFAVGGVYFADFAALTSVFAGYHQHCIIAFDIHSFLHSSSKFEVQSSKWWFCLEP
jgi:hypothetical protein